MGHDSSKYLYDMLDAAEFLLVFIAHRKSDELSNDRGFRSAVERELQNMGEALFQLRRIDPACANCITEHQRIIGLRHVLVHGYDQIKPAVLWDILQSKLTTLRDEVKKLLADIDSA